MIYGGSMLLLIMLHLSASLGRSWFMSRMARGVSRDLQSGQPNLAAPDLMPAWALPGACFRPILTLHPDSGMLCLMEMMLEHGFHRCMGGPPGKRLLISFREPATLRFTGGP
jgi:hypothetical protein